MRRVPNSEGAASFTLVELLVIIATTVLLIGLFAWAVPRQRQRARLEACANNLKQVGLGFRIFNSEIPWYQMRIPTNEGGTMEWVVRGEVWPHFQVMSNELNTPKVLVCPADTRRPAAAWTLLANSNISYFVGLDADETDPYLFLSGDSSLKVDGMPVRPGLLSLWTNSIVGWTAERHKRGGNIALADGSVQQYSNAKLREALVQTGVVTNRLAIP